MSAVLSQSYWAGIFVALSLLSSFALAEPATSAVPAAPVTAVDPKKLVEQAEAALNDEDLVAAIKLFHQAAELNYIPAQVTMGELAESSQFYEESVGWFLMAAMQGDAAGQYNLARMYGTGLGIEKDHAKALYWMRRSAAKDYLPAASVIATSYRAGGFSGLIKIDLDQAKLWDAKVSRLSAIAEKEAAERRAALTAAKRKLQAEQAAKKANSK